MTNRLNYMKIVLLIATFYSSIVPQLKFDEYFQNKTLRIDYFHSGDKSFEYYSIDELIEEPYWGGSTVNLIDQHNYGAYKVVVKDSSGDKIIYSRTYSTLFSEWQTTNEAKQTSRTFSETVTMPYPKNKISVEFFSRDSLNQFVKKFRIVVDPNSKFIKKERTKQFETFSVLNSGEPSKCVDIVFLPEGYTQSELEKFRDDCKKFVNYFFQYSPYSENKEKFNFWGVLSPSIESGTDFPTKGIWTKTEFNSNFATFGTERYLMTTDNKSVRNAASNVPYDQIYILVNTDKYGGGSIYNFFSVCMSDNRAEKEVFIHEFGHGFASLADEYVTDDVSYENFYNLSLEPVDPNLTTLIDFDSKWKNMVEPGTPIPTPPTDEFKNKVGAFEGGGYMAKGIYRPSYNCIMRGLNAVGFCPVCEKAIQAMIDFYSN